MYLYENWVEDEDGQPVEDYKVCFIDDTTLKGDTLARRRLRMKSLGVPLMRLTKAFFFLGDLIKVATPKTWFIDSNGKIFNYHKQTRAKLKFHKVEKIIPLPSGGVIVEPDNLSVRFKALFAPNIPLSELYVGILYLGLSPILYGFYDKKYNDTWRLV
jgi:hypothetical protein